MDGGNFARLVALAILGGAIVGGVVLARHSAHAPAPVVAKPMPLMAKPAPTKAVVPAPAAPEPYVIRRVLPIEGVMKQGDWHWDEAGVPAGPGTIVVTVDVAARVLSVFRDGYEIGTAVIASGSPDRQTPLGVFPVTQKDADHVSNIYDAPMPYMLRLTNDGVSIHGSKIGTDEVSYVTHGCVGVPTPFARKLFGVVKLGDRVIVSHGETLNVGRPIPAA